jgi:hypothetical protein
VWVGREAVWPCSLTEDSDLDQVNAYHQCILAGDIQCNEH